MKNEEGPETREALAAESSSVIVDEPDLQSPRDDVLQHFIRTLDGGFTLDDAAIDKDDRPSPLLLNGDTDAEGELDMKQYKTIDPLSPISPRLPFTEVCRMCRR